MDGIGLLNVCVGVNLLNPTKTTYRDALVTGTGTKKTLPKSVSQVTLDWWKLYVDSCTTNHTELVDWYLDNVHDVDIVLKGNCNTGGTTSN